MTVNDCPPNITGVEKEWYNTSFFFCVSQHTSSQAKLCTGLDGDGDGGEQSFLSFTLDK